MIKFLKHALCNLDTLGSFCGIVFGIILLIISLFKNPTYAIMGSIILFSSFFYIYFVKNNEKSFSVDLKLEKNQKKIKLLFNILFFSIFTLSIISYYLRPDLYSRPITYFILIFVLIMLLSSEILFTSYTKKYSYILLLKIITIPLSLVITQSFLFPSVIGIDPWYHQYITETIFNGGIVPIGGETYSYMNLPVMHLIIGTNSLFTQFNYKVATVISISLVQIITLLVFLFIIAEKVTNHRIALLSTLIYAFCKPFILFSYITIPFTLSVIWIVMIVYLLLFKEHRNYIINILVIILMFLLILTHSIGSILAFIVLITIFIITKIIQLLKMEKPIFKHKSKISLISYSIPLFFLILMLSWWMYVSNDFATFLMLIKNAFDVDFYMTTADIVPEIFSYPVPYWEYLLNYIGSEYLVWGLAMIGCFFLVSKKMINFQRISTVSIALIILFISLIASFGSFEILSYRWYYPADLFLVIPLAVSIFLIYTSFADRLPRKFLILLLITLIAFPMVFNTFTSIDSPLTDNNVYQALTSQEIESLNTIQDVSVDKIGIDRLGLKCINNTYKTAPVFLIQNNLYQKNFTEGFDTKNSIVIIRKRVFQEPINNNGINITKLNYNPIDILETDNFSQLYDSGNVYAFKYI